MSAERTLGSELRSARLGYRWLAQVGRYVRVVDWVTPDASKWECWRVEWCTPDRLPSRPTISARRAEGPGHHGLHRAWWEVDGADVALTKAIRAQWPDVLPAAGGFTHAEELPQGYMNEPQP